MSSKFSNYKRKGETVQGAVYLGEEKAESGQKTTKLFAYFVYYKSRYSVTTFEVDVMEDISLGSISFFDITNNALS